MLGDSHAATSRSARTGVLFAVSFGMENGATGLF
jgi:hypothetical protein